MYSTVRIGSALYIGQSKIVINLPVVPATRRTCLEEVDVDCRLSLSRRQEDQPQLVDSEPSPLALELFPIERA